MTKLQILKNPTTEQNTYSKDLSAREVRQQELKAYYDRLWITERSSLDPLYSSIGIERIQRIWYLLVEYIPQMESKKAVDLGAGSGEISLLLKQKGALVKSLDISLNALKIIEEKDPSIQRIRGCLPHTIFNDDEFDIVVASDVLAELEEIHYRLFFSELARIVKKEGYVVCSTPLDYHSLNAINHLENLAKTEFEILEWRVSCHRLLIFLQNFWGFPELIVKAMGNPEYQKKWLSSKKGLSRIMLSFCQKKPFWLFWKTLSIITKPLHHYLLTNLSILKLLEKATYLIWGDNGVSHAIFIARKKSFSLKN